MIKTNLMIVCNKPAGLLLAILIISFRAVLAQVPAFDTAAMHRIQIASDDDHRKMMVLLHIDSIRRGADGNNPKSPFAANYDESKANPYTELPDPLVLKNGKQVTTAKDWWATASGDRRRLRPGDLWPGSSQHPQG
jgi:hypothetical protein